MTKTSNKPAPRLRPSAIRNQFRRFGPHVLEYRGLLSWAALCMLGVTVTILIRPWPMKYIFDGVLIPSFSGQTVTQGDNFLATLDPQALAAVAAIAILLIAVANGLLTYGQTFLTARVSQGVTASLRRRVYAHLQHLSRSFHDQRRTGDLMVRLTGDVRLVQDMLVTTSMLLVDRGLLIGSMLGIMFWLDWQLTLIAVAIVPALLAVIVYYMRRIKQAARRQRKRESEIASEMTEKLSAITIVQAFARQSHEHEQFALHNQNSVQASLAATKLEAHLGRTVQIIIALGVGGVVWFGVSRVQTGVLTPGELLVFIAYMKGLYKPLRKLANVTSKTIKSTVSGERLLTILDTELAITDAPNAIDTIGFKGDIVFDRVGFSYQGSAPVLSDASVHILPGEHVALLGESGAGKSTVASLLLRLYDPVEGRVCIDGRDIREYTLTSLRDQIALVMQDAMLFRTSIAENIAYGRLDASESDIESAARAANAHEFITRLPEGYATIVGERGDTLSGGQRQRIAIARALIRHASIVILDEPVSGLDQNNRMQVETALARLTHGRTCLTITHDPQVARRADRILMIRQGQLQELDVNDLPSLTAQRQLSIVPTGPKVG